MSRARDIANYTTPTLGGNLDLNSQDITGTGNINTTGNATITGNLSADGRNIVPLAKGTELATTDDWNNTTPNAVGYYAGGGVTSNNGGFSNNGVYMYLSTRFLDSGADNATDERAAQLYFGDTIQPGSGGVHYRVKQGSAVGWHDWGRILTSVSKGAVVQTAFDTTDAITQTTSQSGFTALEAALTPTRNNSRMLVIANVYGSAGDDAHAWLEYKIGSGSWTRNTNLNGQYAGGMAMGDYSILRSISEQDQQVGMGTSVIWHPNTTSEVRIRVICSCENTAGFNLNIGQSRDTANVYNNCTSKSTLVIQEIAWD